MAAIKLFLLAFLLAGVLFYIPKCRAELRLISEFNLPNSASAASETAFPILAIRFSPDAKRLAIVAGPYQKAGGVLTSLFIISLIGDGAVRRFEIPEGANDIAEYGRFLVGWSPDGTMLLAGRQLLDLVEGRTCQISEIGGLAGDKLAVEYSTDQNRALSNILVFDNECREKSRWTVHESWYIRAISSHRGVLLVDHQIGSLQMEKVLVDAFAQKVLRRWAPGQLDGQEFADAGNAICGGRSASSDSHPRCWETDTGKLINIAANVRGGFPIATAADSSRIIVSDYLLRPNLFFGDNDEVLRRRVVWDFASNRVIGSWAPRFQKRALLTSKIGRIITEPDRFDISRDGNYVAEGADGNVRILRVIP